MTVSMPFRSSPCSPADLLHDPLERIVGADLLPVDVRKCVIGQGLLDAALHQLGCRSHSGLAQNVDDRAGLAISRLPGLLGVNGLEHVADLADPGDWHMAEHIAIEMHHAALPAGLRQILGCTLGQPAASIRNDQLDTLEATIDQVPQECRPAGFVFLGALPATWALAKLS